jgi:hypothetical protein
VLRFGFLDGVPGLIYCGFQGIQFFHIKAKLYEVKLRSEVPRPAIREPNRVEECHVRN